MKENIIRVNDLLTVSKLPASDYVINPYVGCPHGCKYCYACFMKRFTGHDEPWGEFVDIKMCDKPIKVDKLQGKSLFMSSVTDCYNPAEAKYEVTRSILKQLVGVDVELTIGTKSKLILRDLDLIRQMKNLTVSMSINTLDDGFQADMDHASSIQERLYTLKILHDNGIRTVLFMSPIFPMITDYKAIIDTSKDYIDTYWFENLNLRANFKTVIMDYVKGNYPQYYDQYVQIYNQKDMSYWVELGKDIDRYCLDNHIDYINYFYHEKIRKP